MTKIKIRVTFSYKLAYNIRTTFEVKDLQEEDPMCYRRLALTELLKLGYTRVNLIKIEILE